jgi:hypothetical protein
MNKSKSDRITAMLLVVAAYAGPFPASGEMRKITADEARVIADQRLSPTEFSGAEATFVGFYSNVENRCLDFDNPGPRAEAREEEVKKALQNRRYYLVMYEPPSDTIFGSTICVFVDESGDVLDAGLF